ncbi:nitrilase-like protein 2 [Gossypium australe]|uniref:Nitrilase-like protein 2 n=1 Tax=Gossypium australe TaxID=47621 RepID=A0A5B6WJY2_9ROSI|nr:nitrilase-like protein 2 [Gossypium australe]
MLNCCLHFCLSGARLPRPLKSSHVNAYSSFSAVRSSADSAMAALNSVRVAAVQMTSVNDLASNFSTCSRLVKEAASAGAKMICFPESFSFLGPKSEDSLLVAEALDGPIMQKYCSLAREYSIWLSLGGFQVKGHDAHLRNTHVIVDDAGNIRSTYSKIHLFDVDVPGGSTYRESSFTEPGDLLILFYAIGKDVAAVDSPIGRLGLTICYDLRFPEIYQQLRFNHDAQVILVPSAFTPVTGQAHWEILLRARAIETQCYVIASAQAGKHNEKRESYGDTLIIDPWGTVVGRLPGMIIGYVTLKSSLIFPVSDRLSTGITVADIDLSLIDSVRKKMPIAEVWGSIHALPSSTPWVSTMHQFFSGVVSTLERLPEASLDKTLKQRKPFDFWRPASS